MHYSMQMLGHGLCLNRVFAVFFRVLWKVRQLTRTSISRRRADIRLSIMLVTTHLITICYFIGNYIVNYVYTSERPVFYYLVLKITPFIVHCMLW
ncbi:unnamed protein product, partial [Mesorhabditis belari]|uniref:Uncharacterized protein n=1 Tax=Mesorhabditis belari TaxID=2138241 RepID=A0AAF3EAT4_9BILA